MQIRPEQSSFLKKYRWMTVFIVLSFAVLLGRLVQMQLIQGHDYRDQAHNLMIRRITIKAKRGVIMDRRGRVMVDNEINFNVYIVPRYFPPEAFGKLKKYLKLDDEQSRHIQRKILGAQGDRRAFSLLAVPAISWDQRARLETNAFELPGVRVLTEWKRRYPYGNLAAHTLGGRRQNDKRLLRLLGPPSKRRQRPRTGSNLVLTLDLDLQRIVESSLRWHPAGAAVVVEVNTGRILAMSSKPAFDPAMLSSRLSREQARQLYDNPYHPMLDKTVMGSYFPGSTFKVITAIAALEERLANTHEYIFCKGYHEYGRKSAFRCTSKHGPMHFHNAIVRSCNIYFYTLGQRVGMNRLSRYARDFGLGTPTGLGLNGERGGFIPTKAWYAKNMPDGFRIGHTLNASVGQGNVTTTPLQLAMAYATIANGGKLYLPQIVQRLETSEGKTVRRYPPVLRRRVQVSDRTFRLVKAGLRGVVNEPGGTAHNAWDGRLSVAGKTGTAQVIKRERKSRDPRDWWRFEDHAWFAAYAPADNPEIAVVVLIEHGGSAGKVAAPIVMRIVRDYFAKVRPKSNRPGHGKRIR